MHRVRLNSNRQYVIQWVSRCTTCVIAALIAYLTLTPIPHAPVNTLIGLDKLYHFMAFAALMLPSGVLPWRQRLATLIAAILFGGGIEIAQPFVERTASIGDFFADCSGAVSGLLFARVMMKNLDGSTHFKLNK